MQQVDNNNKMFRRAQKVTDMIVSTFIFATIMVLIFYAGYVTFVLLLDLVKLRLDNILHDVALIVVLVKAYRLLLFYLERHHVSIKYVVEIAIIAPVVEIIFAYANQPLAINILFAAVSISNLAVYLVFYRRLNYLDEHCEDRHSVGLR